MMIWWLEHRIVIDFWNFVVFVCLKCEKLDLEIGSPKEIDAPRCWPDAAEQRGCGHHSL